MSCRCKTEQQSAISKTRNKKQKIYENEEGDTEIFEHFEQMQANAYVQRVMKQNIKQTNRNECTTGEKERQILLCIFEQFAGPLTTRISLSLSLFTEKIVERRSIKV